MSGLRSASDALGVLVFAGIFAICVVGGPKSAALAKVVPLLFVSDSKANVVKIFSVPGLAVTGTITGLSQPRGLCTDNSGNIWVTNYGTQQSFKYSRTGTLLATLNDPTGFPIGCGVDSGNNLYTANFVDLSGPGEIQPPGHPSWNYPPMKNDFALDFAPDYNLYFDGLTSGGSFILAVRPAGSTTISTITISGGTIHYPGMVQWNATGNYLAVGDRKCGTPRTTCIYHVSISGSTGTIIGKTTFKAYNGHAICDMGQGVIGPSDNYFAGGDDETACGYATSGVYRWAFPAGGAPTNYNNTALTHPFGTAISAK